MKRIAVIVINNFTNDSRVMRESISLKKIGLVTVVALHEEPLPQQEVKNGINIHRVRLRSRKWPKKKIVQFMKYLEFFFKVVISYRNFDVFHCNDLNTLPIGVFVKVFLNKDIKIVYDAHEYEIEVNKLNIVQKKVLKLIEGFLITFTDGVITVGESIAREYAKLYGISLPRVVMNTPYYTPRQFGSKNVFREKFCIDEMRPLFLYQGVLGYGRGIELLLRSFAELSERNDKGEVPAIVFMGIAGGGDLLEKIKRASLKYGNIYYHEPVEPEILLRYTAAADFGIAIAENTSLSYRYSLPNKLFEYLMACLPVIVSNSHEMRRFVESNKVGIVLSQNNVECVKDTVMRMTVLNIAKTRANINRVRRIFNWEMQEKVLLRVYNGLFQGFDGDHFEE